MKIRKIYIENFYSFKKAEINLEDYSSLTLIKGKNKDTGGSNGSGKSVLVEAIYFALTGKTIRKSTESTLVNNQTKKKCCVSIELEHNGKNVVISRGKKPTKLELFIDGDPYIQQNVYSTQAYIDDFLNINSKVLLFSMFFGQANTLNFLDCTPDDKRTIIKNFLNLDDIFVLRERIKSFKSTFSANIKQLDAVNREVESSIRKLETKLKQIEEDKKKFEGFTDVDISLEDVIRIETKNYKASCNIDIRKADIKKLRIKDARIVDSLEHPDRASLCNSCNQPLPKDSKKHLQEERKKISNFIKTCEEDIVKMSSEIIPPPISSKDYSNYLSYKELCRDSEKFEEFLVDLNESIQNNDKEKEDNKVQYEVMRFWEKAFSEQGIIKYIIKNVLDYFNEKCNYYLSYLTNSKYFVEFDDELTEKITTLGHEVAYISLSGGEKRKLNLATTLALKDLLLLTDKSHINLLFFDEIAENLDEEGIQGLYQLLQEIKKTKTIFIITHNKYLKTLLDSAQRLSIIKTKGISRVI